MHRAIRRFTLASFVALVISGLSAAAVFAAPSPTATTQPAANVTATAAVLHGTIKTSGGTDTWQFQFGRTLPYDKATPFRQISGEGANKTVSVTWVLTNLTPNTLYHFRLAVTTGKGTSSSQTSDGADLTFKTKPRGKLLLNSTTLSVKRGSMMVPFTCASLLQCDGNFSVVTRARLAKTHKLATIVCTKSRDTFFRIPAGKRANVKAPVSAACTALIKSSPTHSIKGKLTSRPRTGQFGVIANVTLK